MRKVKDIVIGITVAIAIMVAALVGAAILIGIGLVVTPTLFPTPTPLPTPTPIPGSISGTASWQLKGGSNIVLPGLVVSVKKCISCTPYATGVTDAMGNYKITGLVPMPYWITAYQKPSTDALGTVAEKCWFFATAVFPATDTQVNLHYGNTENPIICK